MDCLFDQVHTTLQGQRNRRGWHDAACPFCGKPAAKGQVHFGYNATGFKCWVCGVHGSLRTLAEHLHLDAPVTPVTRPEPAPVPTARWRQNPTELLRRYRTADRYAAWRQYKPLTTDTIDRFDFGFGKLPFQRDSGEWYLSQAQWLTVPLWESGQLVGLRGRNRGNKGPKWISATGSTYTLWGVDYVRRGSVTWLCENYVDAAWLVQEHPAWSAVAIGGATTWQPAWVDLLAQRQPQVVIVALDWDLPGQATGAFRSKLEAAWVQERGTKPPEANGPKIANELRRHGLNAVLFQYPDYAPEKADVGWLLGQKNKTEPKYE